MGGAGLGAATWVRGTGAGLPALWAGLGGVRTFFLAATGLPFGAAGFIAFVLGLRPFAAFFPPRAGRRPFPPRPFGFGLGTYTLLLMSSLHDKARPAPHQVLGLERRAAHRLAPGALCDRDPLFPQIPPRP